MQAGQLGRLVAALTGGRGRYALGAVRTMAVGARRGDAAVRRLRLLRVTGGARSCNGAGVWLVAAPAALMTGGRAALLGAVAAGAVFRDRACVRLMAAGALLVSGFHRCLLCGVAAAAALGAELGPMRQAGVAALARLVAGQGLDAGYLTSVALLAGAPIGRFADEVVRLMTTLAVHVGVEGFVAARFLVASAARADPRAELGAGGVRIVAAHAAADLALPRVIGVLVGVAARARLVGASRDVVRVVAARALTVTAGMPRAEHRDVFVAAATRDRLLLAELVRLMAADAGHVSALEQRASGDDRLGLLVAGDARGERFDAGRVLLLMARRANLVGCLAREGVGGLNVLVTRRAGSGLGRAVSVRTVTVEALAGVVNLHGRSQHLTRGVAVQAVTRLMGVGRVVARAFEAAHVGVIAEAMTERAIALHFGSQARASFGRGMRDGRLLLVALRAASRRNGAHLRVADGVTSVARHLLLQDMRVVPVARPYFRPARGHVHAAAGVRRGHTVAAGTGRHDQQLAERGEPVA